MISSIEKNEYVELDCSVFMVTSSMTILMKTGFTIRNHFVE